MTREEASSVLIMLKERELNALENIRKYPFPQRTLTIAQALDLAIEALQREIPKNPTVNYVADSDGARRLNDGWTEDSYLCPVCHTYFGEIYDEGYCRNCGQKLIQKRVRVIGE